MRGESIKCRIEGRAIPLHAEQVRLVLERITIIKGDKDDGWGRRLILVLVPGRRLACQTDEHLCVTSQPVHHQLRVVVFQLVDLQRKAPEKEQMR